MSGSQYWLDASPVTPPHLHSWLPRCGGIGKKTNPQGNLTRTRSALTPFGIATACTISPFFPISVERHRTARTVIECAQPRTKIKKTIHQQKKKVFKPPETSWIFRFLIKHHHIHHPLTASYRINGTHIKCIGHIHCL